MTLTEKLSTLISTYMSRPGHVVETKSESDFIMSGLRAANGASTIARWKILSDVSDVLDCKPEDLEFMFSDFSTPVAAAVSQEIIVPDFRAELYSVAE
jgi:hypothetical protein